MADSKTTHRSRTATHTVADASGCEDVPRTQGLVSMVAGALGVVAAVVPAPGLVALVLAAIAIGAGVPAMRRGPAAAGFGFARLGVVLGMIAVLLGVLILGMQLLS